MDSPFTRLQPAPAPRRRKWVLPFIALCAIGLVAYAWFAGIIPFWNPFQAPLKGTVGGFSVERFNTNEGQPVQGAFLYHLDDDRIVPLQPQVGGVIMAAARSPHAGRVAYVAADTQGQSLVVDFVPNTVATTIATTSKSSMSNLIWSADGSRLAYSAIRIGTSTGSLPLTMLAEEKDGNWKVRALGVGIPLTFSPDGTFLLSFNGEKTQVYVVDGSGRPAANTRIEIPTAYAFFSPDARYVAYRTDSGFTILPIAWDTLTAGEPMTIKGHFTRRGAYTSDHQLLLLDAQGNLHRYENIDAGRPRKTGQFRLSVPVPYALTEWITP